MKKLLVIIIVTSLYTACSKVEKFQDKKIPISRDLVMKDAIRFSIIRDSIRLATPIDSALGDLDKDGIKEKVLVFDTHEWAYYGKARSLNIYKQVNGVSQLFYQSKNGYYPKPHNQNPYLITKIKIEKGILKFTLYYKAENNMKKFYHKKETYKYRFQNNDFVLIGWTNDQWVDCFYKRRVDYNLSTGKVIHTKRLLECSPSPYDLSDDKPEYEVFYQKMDKTITLKNFHFYWNDIISPKYGHTFSF